MNRHLPIIKRQHHFLRYRDVMIASMPIMTAFTSDFWLPSIPKIATNLHLMTSQVSTCINDYLLVLALAQLGWGWLAIWTSRCFCLVLGCLFIAVGSLLLMLVHHYPQLLAARLVQGLGAAALLGLYRTFLVDQREKGQTAFRMFRVVSLILLLSPSASMLGGMLLQQQGTWQRTQGFMVLLSALLAFFYRYHQTTLGLSDQINRQRISFCKWFSMSQAIWQNRQFLAAVSCDGLALSLLVIYLSNSPWIYQVIYHFSPKQHGLLIMLDGGSAMLACYSYRRWLIRLKSQLLMLVAGLGVILIAFGMKYSSTGSVLPSLWLFVLFIQLLVFVMTFVFARTLEEANSTVHAHPWVVVSWFGAGQMMIASLSNRWLAPQGIMDIHQLAHAFLWPGLFIVLLAYAGMDKSR